MKLKKNKTKQTAEFRVSKKLIILFLGLIFAFTLIILGLVFILFNTNDLPSNKELIRNYYSNKTEFNNLVKRIQVDQKKGLERIDDSWTRPEDVTTIGLTEKDVINYRKEFIELKVPRGFYAYPDSVDFIAYASGLSISGGGRGYLYSTKEPKNYIKENCGYSLRPFKDLNDYHGCNGYASPHTIYQQIDKNWYIYDDLR